ncbi:MAG TPA: DUF488 domain-containing protein, partial [Thermodesulfatator sp.]|nr:DUF488 domain-containing protein [Thermodesulfatator sp.]
FLRLLRAQGIEQVIDVRRFPVSHRFPHFSRQVLEDSLRRKGIRYRFLGRELGGYRSGGYETYRATEAYRTALERLQTLAAERPSVIICAERFPWRCHRRHLAEDLSRLGWRVIHILDEKRLWEPSGGDIPGDNEKGPGRCSP